MTFVLTLIAAKSKGNLTEDLSKEVVDQTSAAEIVTGEMEWLSEGEAFCIPFQDQPARVQGLVREILADHPVDVAVIPAENRRKKLLIADMDSTMIEQECIDELAAEIGQADAVSAITEKAMNGAIEFNAALRERVALLKGIPESTIERVLADRISLTPGGRTLVETMRANGAVTALVSGGFTAFAGPLADRIGFQHYHANTLLTADSSLTGEVAEPILGRDAKLLMLRNLSRQNHLDLADGLAVGDGANDLAMLEAAGLGVAFHAKPIVQERAGVRINYCDLTALLFLQGYKREEFYEIE